MGCYMNNAALKIGWRIYWSPCVFAVSFHLNQLINT